MKTLLLACLIFSAAIELTAFADPTSQDSSRVRVGRIPSHPDVVLEWNAAISDEFDRIPLETPLQVQARVYAMTHLAMRDAVAAAAREKRPDASGSVANIAATVAAHHVLVALLPAGATHFDALQERHVAAFAPHDAAKEGKPVGQRIAATLLRNRESDGWPVMPSSSGAEALRHSGAKPAPFVLKRANQFEPERLYTYFDEGKNLPNRTLRDPRYIGSPADVSPVGTWLGGWRLAAVVQWNRAAHSLALSQPQDLTTRTRLFSSLNTALADALLSATYWSDVYSRGRSEGPLLSALMAYHRVVEEGGTPPDPADLWQTISSLSGFPALPAALAGAAETILRLEFGANAVYALPASTAAPVEFTSLRSAARQCAWSAYLAGASPQEGCVAGYLLGNQVASHVRKQGR